MIHPNAVIRLRDREMCKVTRPFLARGSKVNRCPDCMLGRHLCICEYRPEIETRCAFCLIYYHGEVFKPSNTGRLIADVVKDNYAFQWQRTEVDPGLQALLVDARYQPIVVFPHEYAESAQCISDPQELQAVKAGKIPLFILLDGTWREAKKMFRSAYLQALPVLGIQPEMASAYHLREAAHLHQLCTAEVGVALLGLQGDTHAASALQDYFQIFREHYLAGKANVLRKNIGKNNAVLDQLRQ
jgi:DTW domain-containing protein YfiP